MKPPKLTYKGVHAGVVENFTEIEVSIKPPMWVFITMKNQSGVVKNFIEGTGEKDKE